MPTEETDRFFHNILLCNRLYPCIPSPGASRGTASLAAMIARRDLLCQFDRARALSLQASNGTRDGTAPSRSRLMGTPGRVCEGLEAFDTMSAMPGRLNNWLERHQHPASRVLHALGIPMLVLTGVVTVWQLVESRWDLWYCPVALFVGSYLLQWIGHRVEGNDMGEIILIKRLLGRRYVAVSPRYQGRRA